MTEFGLFAFIMALMVAAGLWLSSAQCHSRWEGSGMKTEWKVIGGCKVQRKDGTWVPASAVRDLSQ
jgi:hypothetical protein